jgi:hypothetical protein
MSPLNIHPEEDSSAAKKKNNKLLKILLGIGLLIAVPLVGKTLAASIAINSGSGNQVQFGQGVVQAAACDSDITVTPVASFTNTSGSGSFQVDTVTVTGIKDACTGKKFKLTAYGDTGTALTLSAGGATSPSCVATPTLASGANSINSETNNTCVGTVAAYSSADENIVYFKPASGLAASTVYKFTLETLNP